MAEAGILRIGNVSIDVRISERHEISMSVTQYAIENGDTISDHVIENPNRVEIEFEMTNTPIGSSGERAGERARRTFQEFIKMMLEKKPVQIITEHATYDNMVFSGFPSEHSAPNLGTLRGAARFEQIGIIGSSNVITEGRSQNVLAGNGFGADNVGSGGISQQGGGIIGDFTYRTAVSALNSSQQSFIQSIPKVEKVYNKLLKYGQGIF